MEYRPLGSTGLEVSVLGFGAAPLGDVFGRIHPKEGVRAVHCAIDHGINFFDVSPYYGHTLAEARLGKALDGKRDRVILATKCGRYDDDDFDFSAQRVTASVEESLRRLGTDYLDLVQAHDIEFADCGQVIHETLPELHRLQAAGKVRFVGITAFPCSVLCEVASAAPVDTILSYCRYNLLIRDMDERLTPLARCRKIGLINASPLLMGILTEAGPPPWHPAPASLKLAGAKIVELCRRNGVAAARVALRFCLDHDYVATTLSGISTTRQVEENVKSCAFACGPENPENRRAGSQPHLAFRQKGKHAMKKWFVAAYLAALICASAQTAFGDEWYPRKMYISGDPVFKHHVETYGPQSKFGAESPTGNRPHRQTCPNERPPV